MNTAIIYHQVKPGIDCADGIAAAWVAKQKYPDATLIGASYGGEVPNIAGFDRVIVVDFSFPLLVLQGWQSDGKEITVIDHHKTAMADLENFSDAVFDMSESGATLTWKTLFPDEPIPVWLQYVKDRDLWNFELPLSEEIHEAVSFMGRKLYQIDFLSKLTEHELQGALGSLGMLLLKPKRERIAELAATAIECYIHGCRAMIVEIPEAETRLVSDTCSAIYKAHPEVDFVMSYSWNSKDNLWALGFRSSRNGSDFDVSQVARLFDGGGHRNASGGKADKLQFVVTYDNSSGYREWASKAQSTPQAAIEASDGLKFGEPRLELA